VDISLKLSNDGGGYQINPALKALGNVHLSLRLRLDIGVFIKSGGAGLGHAPIAVQQAAGVSVWARVIQKVKMQPL
jgi:hypothetical protein